MLKQTVAVLATSLACQLAGAALVTITDNDEVVRASGGGGSIALQSSSATGVPHSELLSVAEGVSSSANQIDYSVVGGQTVLSNSLTQVRGGTRSSFAQARDIDLLFSVDTDTAYLLSGFFSVDDAAATGASVHYTVYLQDVATAAFLFDNEQDSESTVDESFTLGAAGGDFVNILDGSLGGTLLAGRTYRLFFNAFIEAAVDRDDGGATASGSVVLKVGSVPEPGSLPLFALAAAAGTAAWRRRVVA